MRHLLLYLCDSAQRLCPVRTRCDAPAKPEGSKRQSRVGWRLRCAGAGPRAGQSSRTRPRADA
eukprot:1934968-Rhodomonas_salina.1